MSKKKRLVMYQRQIEKLYACFFDASKEKMQAMQHVGIRGHTPPKFNMEPENDGFQKESPFPGTSFQVPC